MYIPDLNTGRRPGYIGMVILLVVTVVAAVLAVPSESYSAELSSRFSSGSEVDVTADSMVLVKDGNRIIFTGNVKLVKDNLELESDKIEVVTDSEGGFSRVVATGNVRVAQDDNHVMAGMAVYDRVKEELVLTGSPKIWNKEYNVEGSRVTIDLKAQKTYVDNSRLIIKPKPE